jgi:uncharacterized Zn-binding protein involved in type VI secretion
MSLPAARATDQQTCPAWNGPANPHVGGPISSGESTVLIGNLPAARLGDPTTCTGPSGTVTSGSPAVLIGNQPAARVTDLAGHGGVITGPGCATVLIGGPAPPAPPPPPPEPEPEDED